jgi:hypothetical protein
LVNNSTWCTTGLSSEAYIIIDTYINNPPSAINNSSIPILFADDASIIATDKSPDILDSKLRTAFQTVNKWFISNLLSINLLETHCMQFKTKNNMLTETKVTYNNNVIIKVPHKNFLV